jgi:hypothetical protein
MFRYPLSTDLLFIERLCIAWSASIVMLGNDGNGVLTFENNDLLAPARFIYSFYHFSFISLVPCSIVLPICIMINCCCVSWADPF